MNDGYISPEAQELINQINEKLNLSRSDKGKKHNYPSKRKSVEQSKMSIYKSVKNRLISQGTDIPLDDNGYYIVTDNQYDAHYGQFSDNKTVHYTRRRGHDVERYRFEAWQDIALTSPDLQVWTHPAFHQDLVKWAIHCSGMTLDYITKYFVQWSPSALELFCEFYHIRRQDVMIFTYDLWREYYECTPKQELDADFEFIFGIRPGTEGCHPEWAYVSIQKELEEAKELEDKKNKKVWSTKIGHMNRRRND